nr:uncharacterized protein LOC109159955 [Ipomoea batatas]
MSEQVVVDSPGATRRQPLLAERMRSAGEEEKRGSAVMIGDFAGGTAACAMVCCCCPCAALHFLVTAVYKTAMVAAAADDSNKGRSSGTACYDEFDDGSSAATEDGFETEMWDRFHEGGFWRSSLDREG